MKKILLKFNILLLITALNWAGLSAIGETFAYFNDTETSSGNTYSMGSLDFSLAGNGIEEYNFGAGNSTTTVANMVNHGSLDFQYTIHTSASGNLCDDLMLTADLLSESGVEYENVNLVGFVSSATTTIGDWEFTVSLPSSSSAVGSCDFDFVFQGWQENVANYGDGGFSDEERMGNIISSQDKIDDPTPEYENEKTDTPAGPANHLVINEVQIDGGGEWVELYNPTSEDVDLSDWKLGYYNSTRGSWDNPYKNLSLVSGATTTIESYGYFLFRVDGTVPDSDGRTTYSNPADTLANDNGTVAIFNSNILATSTLVDAVGWGNVILKEENSAIAPDENKSIERGLTGYDSDDNSVDFIIKNNPTPTNSAGDGMSDIVINEFLAEGNAWDDFVEIYNASSSAISLDGWELIISSAYSSGSTTPLSGNLAAGDWLVIYYEDGNVLQATSTITIYDDLDNEIDKIFYTDADIVDKSFARIPDGSANWVDPIPTPMGTNITEENLELAGLSIEDLEIDFIENDYSVKTTTDEIIVSGGSSSGSTPAADPTPTNPIADPATTDPTTTNPIQTDPTPINSTPTDPVTDPATTDSTQTDPTQTGSATTDPTIDPTQTDPAITDIATDPATTDPATTNPTQTDPVLTDPTQTDPVPTVPEPVLDPVVPAGEAPTVSEAAVPAVPEPSPTPAPEPIAPAPEPTPTSAPAAPAPVAVPDPAPTPAAPAPEPAQETNQE